MVLQIRNSNVAYNEISTIHYSPSKPRLCPWFHWCPPRPWSHISGTRHHSIVVFGVVSGDHRCPEANFITARALGCPRKKITFFSKSGTSQNKRKLVPVPQNTKVYGGISLYVGGIRHITFPLLGQCAFSRTKCSETEKLVGQ